MSTRPETIAGLPPLETERMFEENAPHLQGKVAGLVRDDRLFLKETEAARAHLPDAWLGRPHPGPEPHIDASEAPDTPYLVSSTLQAPTLTLPAPKPKRAK